MNGQYYPYKRERRNGNCKPMLIILAVILFVGLFVQITMLARISSGNKAIAKVEREITELAANAENLEWNINKYHNLEEIEVKAANLGMQRPDETQIRVVSVVYNSNQNTSTHSAEAIGGEEIRN